METAQKNTSNQFDQTTSICLNLFKNKMRDYGTAWRILRVMSLTDQIYIKAQRIRSIQDKGKQKVDDGIPTEFIGIINYSVMALIQLELEKKDDVGLELPPEDAEAYFVKHIKKAKELMENKNHDYGEAWREMRISSMTDLILMKLLRIKQIEDNEGSTISSEGVEANYYDMINYGIFALILLDEKK
jgi:ribosomal protein L24